MPSRTSNDFHVAIVGAGVGGLALAMACHKKGISFTLYEAAKEFSAVGAGIGFAPNGLKAMDAIEPGFRPLYGKVCVGNKRADAQDVFFEGMLLKEGMGEGQPWHGKSSWGHPDFNRKSAHRKDLLEIMTSFVPAETVQFNKRLSEVEQHPDKVVMKFEDGSSAEASVLAGADGIKSVTRSHVLQPYPSQVAPVYANAYCYRAVIPIDEAQEIMGDLTDVAKFFFGHNRGAISYRITSGKELNYLLCVADPEPWNLENAVTERISHEAMMSDFQGEGVDDRFRQLLAKAEPVKWGLFHHLRTSTYYRGRVALLGDSAHASLPFNAAGAAQGLEDALILANVLEELSKLHPSEADSTSRIERALDAYDSVRRPRAQRQLEEAAEVGRMIFFKHEEAGDDMSKLLAMMQHGRLDWIWFHDIIGDVNTAVARMHEKGRVASQL